MIISSLSWFDIFKYNAKSQTKKTHNAHVIQFIKLHSQFTQNARYGTTMSTIQQCPISYDRVLWLIRITRRVLFFSQKISTVLYNRSINKKFILSNLCLDSTVPVFALFHQNSSNQATAEVFCISDQHMMFPHWMNHPFEWMSQRLITIVQSGENKSICVAEHAEMIFLMLYKANLHVLEGVMVEEPSCIERLWWSAGLAETMSSSGFVRLSWKVMVLHPTRSVCQTGWNTDHEDGMRGRVECHQHSSDRKSHVSKWQILMMTCRWRRKVVQALSLEELQKQEDVSQRPHTWKTPWRTYLRSKTWTTGVQLLRWPSS